MCILDAIVYPIWTTSHRRFFTQPPDCGDMAYGRVSVTTWAFCPIRVKVSRLRGGPQGSRTSTSLDALPRSSPFRETITQWDSAQNGYFDVPGIIGNTFQRRVPLKSIEWERTGSIQFQHHSWSLLQLPFRRVPYPYICYDPPIFQTVNCCYFVFFMMHKSKRDIFLFFLLPAQSSESPSVISLYLAQTSFFFFFLVLSEVA